jgi:anti-sigma-K factor RskA
MPHVDPDTLALLALGEKVADDDSRAHLAACAECAADLNALQRAATAGRSTFDAGELVEPAPRVWDRIVDELGMAEPAELAPEPAPRPVVELQPRRIRWARTAAVAASIAVVAAVGIGVWQWATPGTPKSTVVATATLDAFPGWPDATGEAVVRELDDGQRTVRVTVDAGDVGDRFTEVWLISSDGKRLVSLGTLSGSRGTLPIPSGVDLSVYDLVDVSAEPYDGDPEHSGDSILRGQLS